MIATPADLRAHSELLAEVVRRQSARVAPASFAGADGRGQGDKPKPEGASVQDL
jgi:hypothetical protein